MSLTLIGQPAAQVTLGHLARVGSGQPVLLRGPSGVGKRTAASALAKLWTGDGEQALDFTSVQFVMDETAAGDQMPVSHLREQLIATDTGRGLAVSLEGASPAVQSTLLLALESLPRGCSVVLCADDEEHVLPTIISRCAVVRFGALDEAALRQLSGDLDPHAVDAAIAFCGGSAARLKALAADVDLLAALQRGDVAAFAAKALAVGADEERGLTVHQARRAWMSLLLPTFAAAMPQQAASAGLAQSALTSGLRPDACLAIALS